MKPNCAHTGSTSIKPGDKDEGLPWIKRVCVPAASPDLNAWTLESIDRRANYRSPLHVSPEPDTDWTGGMASKVDEADYS